MYTCKPHSSAEIRRQLNDQQVCLDLRTEGKLTLLGDFQEFFRKRGELELEYARSLDKLVDRFERLARQRNPRFVVYVCFYSWMKEGELHLNPSSLLLTTWKVYVSMMTSHPMIHSSVHCSGFTYLSVFSPNNVVVPA